MARTAVGLFNSRHQAQQAIQELKAIGFADADIGLVMPDDPAESAHAGTGSQSTEGAVAGGILGGTIGALLAATGALVIPGIGPFITGGMLITLIGGATGWLVGALVGLGIPKEDAGYYEDQVQSGRTLVVVRAEERIADAQAILARNGGEVERPGQRVATVAETRATDPTVPAANMAQRSGQERDMMNTKSDDGTIPPTAAREAITTGVDPNVAHTNERQDYLVARPGMSPDVRTTDIIGPDPKDSAYDRAEKVPTAARAGRSQQASESNPAPLSPTDPRRRTDEDEPYLDDANPYGRVIPNQQNRPMGGERTLPDPTSAQRTREQPGEDAANPLPHALNPEPTEDPDRV